VKTSEAQSRHEEPPDGGAQSATNLAYLDRTAWSRIARATDDGEFLNGWLALQCRMGTSVQRGVVVLGEPDGGQYSPAAFWPERSAPTPLLGRAASMAVERRQGVVIRDPDAAGTAVAYPFLVDERLYGLIAVELGRADDIELQVLLRQLQWGSAWIEGWVRRRAAGKDRAAVDRLKLVLDAVSISLEQPNFKAAALATMTELACRLTCHRVSFGLRRHGRIEVAAVSHSTNLARRSELSLALAAAMDEAVDQRATVVFPNPDPQVLMLETAHRSLAELDRVKPQQLITVPVNDHGGSRAAIAFEFAEPAAEGAQRRELAECVAQLVGPALLRAYDEQRPLPVKAVLAGRQQVGRLLGFEHPGRKVAIAVVAAVTCFFSIFTTVFTISSDARLEGLVQRTAAAPFAGFLAEALARPGDRVAQGAVLARLDQRDLALERHAWMMRREQFLKEQQRSIAEHKLAAVKVLDAQIAEATAQIGLLEQKIERTEIKAPFDAQVIDGDHSQALGRSVQQGDALFTLAPLDSYRIVIEVDERDIAHVKKGQRGALLLAALPNEPLPFTITRLLPVTIAAKGRNAFRGEHAIRKISCELTPAGSGLETGIEYDSQPDGEAETGEQETADEARTIEKAAWIDQRNADRKRRLETLDAQQSPRSCRSPGQFVQVRRQFALQNIGIVQQGQEPQNLVRAWRIRAEAGTREFHDLADGRPPIQKPDHQMSLGRETVVPPSSRIVQCIPCLPAHDLTDQADVAAQLQCQWSDKAPIRTDPVCWRERRHGHQCQNCNRTQSVRRRVQIHASSCGSVSILATPSMPGRNVGGTPSSSASTSS
jgi:Barrel-sandwich domain of CusB or HlyD membrane-fusion